MLTYKLLNGNSCLVSYKAGDHTAYLLAASAEQTDPTGNYSIVVEDKNEEVMTVAGLNKAQGIQLIEGIKNSEISLPAQITTVPITSEKEMPKIKKKGLKWFVGLFMGFAILSFIIRIRDYSSSGAGGISIFNSVMTLFFIAIVCGGIYIYFFRKKNNKNADT